MRSFIAVGGFALVGCASQPAPCEATSPATVAAATPTGDVTIDRAPAATPTPSPAPAPDGATTQPAPTPQPTAPPSDPLATVTTAPSAPAGTAGGTCTANFNAIPAASVALDGVDLGVTPRLAVSVSAGVPHRATFRSDAVPGARTVSFTCQAGKKQNVIVRMDGAPAAPPPSDPFASPR